MEGAARPAVNRTLHRAILWSLVLHGIVLFGWSVERITARREAPRPPLEARLVEPPAPPAPPAPAPPAPEVEAVQPTPLPAPRVAKPKPKPVPRPRTPLLAEPRPAPVPQPAPPPTPQPEPAPSPQAAPPGVAKIDPVPALPSAPVQSAEQVETMTREQYRLAVIAAARRHNRYPPLARENNWEGEVLVRMEIGADGRVSLGIEKSSGHPVLDRQAMEMFRRAQSQVAIPPSLRGKALVLQLRAIYNLKDQLSG